MVYPIKYSARYRFIIQVLYNQCLIFAKQHLDRKAFGNVISIQVKQPNSREKNDTQKVTGV